MNWTVTKVEIAIHAVPKLITHFGDTGKTECQI